MNTKLKISKLEQTCSACPSQWDAWTKEGEYIYIRYRWGNLTISTGDKFKRIFNKQIGDELDGYIDISEVQNITEEFIDWSSYTYD